MYKFDLNKNKIHRFKEYNGSVPATEGNDFALYEVDFVKGTHATVVY